MKKLLLLIAIFSAPAFALSPCAAGGGTWYVGLHNANYPVGKFSANLAAAASHLTAGMTLCIDALDNAQWTLNNASVQNNNRIQFGATSGANAPDNIRVLGFRSDTGADARVTLNCTLCTTLNAQGMWNVYSHHFEADYIEFIGCCTAGGSSQTSIWGEYTVVQMTLKHDYFRNNVMGLLQEGAGGVGANVDIEYCEFAWNGNNVSSPTTSGTGQTHNVYIDAVDTLTWKHNYTHDSEVGHLFKSRAHHNILAYSFFIDSQNAYSYDQTNFGDTTSVEINLPISGAYVYENVIQQSANAPIRSTTFAAGGNPRILQVDPECNIAEEHWFASTRLLAPINTAPAPGTVETIQVDPSYSFQFGAPPFTVELASMNQSNGQINPTNTSETLISASDFPTTVPFYINYGGTSTDQVTAVAGNVFTITRGVDGTTIHTIFDRSMVYLWHPEQFCVTSESADHSQWTGTRGCNGTTVTTHTWLGAEAVHKVIPMPPAFGDGPQYANIDSTLYLVGNTILSSSLGFTNATAAAGSTSNVGVVTFGMQNVGSNAVMANACNVNPQAPLIQNNAIVAASGFTQTNGNSTTNTTTPSQLPLSVITAEPIIYGPAAEPSCAGSSAPCDSLNQNTFEGNAESGNEQDILNYFYAPLSDIQPSWNLIYGAGFTGQTGTAWVNSATCGGSCLTHVFNAGDVISFTNDGTHWYPYLCTATNTGLRPDQNPGSWRIQYDTQSGFLDYHLKTGSPAIGTGAALPAMPNIACGASYADTCTPGENQYPIFPFGTGTRTTTTDSGAYPFINGYAPPTNLTITGPSTIQPGASGNYTVTLPSPATQFTEIVFLSSSERSVARPPTADIDEGQTSVVVPFTARSTAILGTNVTMTAFAADGNMAQTNTQIMAPPTSSFVVTGSFTFTGKITVQ